MNVQTEKARDEGPAALSAQKWAEIKQQLMQENQGYYILNLMKMHSDSQTVYLVADRAVYRDQLLRQNQEKLQDVASHIRTALGRDVAVKAVTKEEFSVRPATQQAEDGLDSLLAQIGGQIHVE